jgi:hypothetical protein
LVTGIAEVSFCRALFDRGRERHAMATTENADAETFTRNMNESVRDLFETHNGAPYPPALAGEAEIAGVSLIILDSDISGLAQSFIAANGALRADQWLTLRDCLDHARTILPALTGESWVYFARLFALGQAMLRSRPDGSSSER